MRQDLTDKISRKENMDLKHEVGDMAGKVWQMLNDNGPQTLAQVKKKLDGKSDVLTFAVGWLAREGKIEITQEKKSLRLELK